MNLIKLLQMLEPYYWEQYFVHITKWEIPQDPFNGILVFDDINIAEDILREGIEAYDRKYLGVI